jgi:hypothetical protein
VTAHVSRSGQFIYVYFILGFSWVDLYVYSVKVASLSWGMWGQVTPMFFFKFLLVGSD